MGRSVIVITVDGNQFKVEKNGISDFALIGVLECLISDLKANREKLESNLKPNEDHAEEKSGPAENEKVETSFGEQAILETSADLTDQKMETPQKQGTTPSNEIKNRIINARRAIRELKGQVEETDLNTMTDDELQSEFEELTNQYKRLKSSQTTAKSPRK